MILLSSLSKLTSTTHPFNGACFSVATCSMCYLNWHTAYANDYAELVYIWKHHNNILQICMILLSSLSKLTSTTHPFNGACFSVATCSMCYLNWHTAYANDYAELVYIWKHHNNILQICMILLSSLSKLTSTTHPFNGACFSVATCSMCYLNWHTAYANDYAELVYIWKHHNNILQICIVV